MQSSNTPTQDTNKKVTNSQLDTTNESQEVSPFPAGNHKAQINRRAQRHSKHKSEKNMKDPQKKYRLGTVSKIFYWTMQHNAALLVRLEPSSPRSRKLVSALLNIINFEFSHIFRNVSSGFQDRPGKIQSAYSATETSCTMDILVLA